jgi:hypothetical protein
MGNLEWFEKLLIFRLMHFLLEDLKNTKAIELYFKN